LGSGFNQSTNASAPLPTDYGIDQSCTFNSNDPCKANAHDANTSVDIIDHAMDFITSAKSAGRPFYVNIWLHVSHNRLDPTEAQKAAAHGVCMQRGLATNQTFCAQQVFVAAQQDADAQVGRLNALLGSQDLHESTLILFSTDNGPEEQAVYSNAQGSTGPFRGRKRSLYEGGTRVPSFAVWGGGTPRPTIPAGAVDHTVMSAADWLPTVAALAAVPLPPGLAERLDGEDMSRVFLRKATGQRLPADRGAPVFWEWRFGVAGPCDSVSPHYAMRDGEWKFLQNHDGARPELYRLDLYNGNATYAPDFHERRNLAAAFPGKVAELAAKLAAWRATIPQCVAFADTPACEQFSSGVFPGVPSAAVAERGEPEVWEDSEPDFWFDPQTGRHESF
jgi:arylsulfatase A-like enzyme